MSGIIRSYFKIPEERILFFITKAELFWLRQRNWVEEDIFIVTNEFWEKHPKPVGVELLENILMEKEGEKPFMVLTEHKYADKLFRREILPALRLKVTSLMFRYSVDENGKITYDEIPTESLGELEKPVWLFLKKEKLSIPPFVVEKNIIEEEWAFKVTEGVIKIKIEGGSEIDIHKLS